MRYLASTEITRHIVSLEHKEVKQAIKDYIKNHMPELNCTDITFDEPKGWFRRANVIVRWRTEE